MTLRWHPTNPSFYTTMNSIHAVQPLGQGQVLLVQPALSLLYMCSSVENNIMVHVEWIVVWITVKIL